MKRSLTGIRATGNLHIGNYLGAIREGVRLQEEYECLYFIADMHSLTTNKDPNLLRMQSLDIAASWIACGLDTQKHLLYRQSDIPVVAEFAWYLSCCTGMGLLQKAHSYKDAIANEKEVNHGVFAYPVLMAADILMYDPDVVPVGKDQKQHVEMSRDMAGSVNSLYGEGVLKLPEPLINEKVMVIPGLDGRKMSKSYNNEIPLFSSEKELRKKVMSITTDSTALEAPKTLDGTLVGQLFSFFASQGEYEDLNKRLSKGGLGWGHAKEELFQAINREIKEARDRYQALRSDEDQLNGILEEGRDKALKIGIPVLNRLREAVGMSPQTCSFKKI
ncbi:MAG: tryptophan--tRNA ligase [Bdellovibrionales bacterium]|nr:tryptophan--tRNA ligase [Bdellovibrionales bacterium]